MDVETVAIKGEWIRHVPHRAELLGRSAEATDGRWQHGRVVRALYLADTAQTAIAEWYRYPAERGLPPSQAIPHDHHYAGLIAPSAARPAARILTVFDRGRWPPEGCRPLRTAEVLQVPAPPTRMTT